MMEQQGSKLSVHGLPCCMDYGATSIVNAVVEPQNTVMLATQQAFQLHQLNYLPFGLTCKMEPFTVIILIQCMIQFNASNSIPYTV